MRGAITDVIAARAKDDGGLGRRFAYSLVAHVVVGLAFILISSNFLSGKQVKPNVIEVSLAGSMGPKTSGVAPIAARRVDQAVPETKRPAPVLPAPPPKPDAMPAPTKATTPPKPADKIPEKAATPTPLPPKPPSTGKQVQVGTAAVETGVTTPGQGLTQAGGGGTGGVVDLNTFDPVWVTAMGDAIKKQWNNLQPETGWTEVLFVVTRDGKVISREAVASSGSFLLNQEAMRAVGLAIIPPLPRDYKDATLRVRLRFNYGGG
ncbi:MAG: TonB C-terminal domain-containing protein [Vicinamibacterales bacterium]